MKLESQSQVTKFEEEELLFLKTDVDADFWAQFLAILEKDLLSLQANKVPKAQEGQGDKVKSL